jgi:acyl carrier protein
VIREQEVERIDLLKIDVERSEEEVLKGIEDEDWRKIDQIVLEAHDEDSAGRRGRVREIVETLEKRGYVVEMEEDEYLRGTGLYNLYARRAEVISAQKSAPAMSRRESNTARSALTTAMLREYLQRRLPEYMTPDAFVALGELPLTRNGKVNRKALPAPERWQRGSEEAYVSPRTPVEEVVADIFKDVLKLDRVGAHDNFFEIGGHSLLATQLISRVRNTFDVEIEVRSVFEAGTVAELAEALIAQEPKPGQMEKIALILKKISGMTDEDMDAELAAMEAIGVNGKIESGND